MSFLFELFSGDKAKFRRDHRDLVPFLTQKSQRLLPITSNELEELSYGPLNQNKEWINKRRYRIGDVLTIFHERVAIFGWRSWAKGKKGSVIVGTNPYLFAFQVRPAFTAVYINDRLFFRIQPDGTMLNGRGRRSIGKLFRYGEHPRLEIGTQEVALLNPVPIRPKHHNRVFQMLFEMEEGIHELIVAMTFFHVIKGQIDLDFDQ